MSDQKSSPAAEAGYPSPGYAAYVVAVLFVVTLSSFLDRSLPALVVAPIRTAFQITNTQFSYLQGYAFAIVYAVAGLPLGRVVDHANRRNLIIIGLLVWSVTTAAAGLATTYWQFFAARMGVGIGEACLAPAAYSIIADCVPQIRRARTIGIYYVSLAIGSGASLFFGGLILHLAPPGGLVLPIVGLMAPWKLAFLFAAAPAVVLAPLLLTIREPARREDAAGAKPQASTLRAFLDHLWRHRLTFSMVYACPALLGIIGYGSLAWAATHYQRRFGVPTSVSGQEIGLLVAGAGLVGSIASGVISDRWLRKGVSAARFRVMAAAWCVVLPGSVAWPLVGDRMASYAIFAVTFVATSVGQAAVPSIVQDVTPNRMRGQAIALYLLLGGLLGIGFGPTAAPMLTDHVFHSDAALGLSLALTAGPAALLGTLAAWFGLKPYAKTVAEVGLSG